MAELVPPKAPATRPGIKFYEQARAAICIEDVGLSQWTSSTNTSGYIGVSPKRKRFGAALYLGNKKLYLGVFDTAEQEHTPP